MEKYELQKLRDLPVEGVAERLGLQVSRHKCLCPFHDDRHPSLSFRVSRNTFRCFVCGASGGTIDLVMRLLRKPFTEACRWLADEHNVITTSEWPRMTGDDRREERTFDASRYERFFLRPFLNKAARRFLYEERRIDARVVRWCRLTSWTDRQGTCWLQIPYYDRDGKLIGVQNRRLEGDDSDDCELNELNELKDSDNNEFNELNELNDSDNCEFNGLNGLKGLNDSDNCGLNELNELNDSDDNEFNGLNGLNDSDDCGLNELNGLKNSDDNELNGLNELNECGNYGLNGLKMCRGLKEARVMSELRNYSTPEVMRESSQKLLKSREARPPRFRFPQGSRCGIYNLPVLNRLRPGDELWIAEGCSDCWALLSAGHKAIAIPSATLLGRKDIELLTELSESLSLTFHMYPDNDVPGERLFMQLKERLTNLTRHQLPTGCKDFGEWWEKASHPTPSP